MTTIKKVFLGLLIVLLFCLMPSMAQAQVLLSWSPEDCIVSDGVNNYNVYCDGANAHTLTAGDVGTIEIWTTGLWTDYSYNEFHQFGPYVFLETTCPNTPIAVSWRMGVMHADYVTVFEDYVQIAVWFNTPESHPENQNWPPYNGALGHSIFYIGWDNPPGSYSVVMWDQEYISANIGGCAQNGISSIFYF